MNWRPHDRLIHPITWPFSNFYKKIREFLKKSSQNCISRLNSAWRLERLVNYGVNQKKKRTLIDDQRYEYNLEKIKNETEFWWCQKFKKGCNGRAISRPSTNLLENEPKHEEDIPTINNSNEAYNNQWDQSTEPNASLMDYYHQLHTWRLPVEEYSSWFSTENARKQKQRDKRTRIKNMTEMYNNIPAPDYMKQLAKTIGMD